MYLHSDYISTPVINNTASQAGEKSPYLSEFIPYLALSLIISQILHYVVKLGYTFIFLK